MTYKDSIDYLLSFTDLELKPGQSLKKNDFDLKNISKLLQLTENPHYLFKSVHVAGSKGKGSTAAMIENGLRSSGKKTGLFTSPHLIDYTERFRVNGKSISQADLMEAIEYLKPFIVKVPGIQTFEIMTALAFHIFAKNHVDWAIIEVGLGGRLDATNVLLPELSVITPIFKEHTHVLGDAIEEISSEKGGIIKPKIPVIISFQPTKEAEDTLVEIAKKRNAISVNASKNVEIKKIENTSSIKIYHKKNEYKATPSLLGDHQLVNIQTTVSALEFLEVSQECIKNAIENTVWSGRFQIEDIGGQAYIFDAAHIPEAMMYLVKTFKSRFDIKPTIIFGASGDKNIIQMVDQLKEIAGSMVLTKAMHPRSADPQKIFQKLIDYNMEISITSSLAEALVLDEVKKSKIVLITGSFFVIGDAMKELRIKID